MYRILLISIILLLTGIINGQGDSQKTISGSDEYSLWLSESLSKLSTKLNLAQFNDINQGLHYRIWFEGQMIDIRRDPENNFEGSLTNFANTASYMQNDKVDGHSTNEKINRYEVEQLFDLLTEYENVDYQDFWLNNEWEIDKVKMLFIIESASDGNYSIEEIWIPKIESDNQDDLRQQKHFASYCSELLDLNKKFDLFFADLPDACYVTSVHTFMCKNDEKSNRANSWLMSKQPIDSILVYLNDQDWGYLATKNDWVLYNNIVIFFDKKDKIKNVVYEIQSGAIHRDDLYSKSIKRLKKQVKKSLLNLDFSLFEPPQSYIIKISLTFNSSNKQLVWGSW